MRAGRSDSTFAGTFPANRVAAPASAPTGVAGALRRQTATAPSLGAEAPRRPGRPGFAAHSQKPLQITTALAVALCRDFPKNPCKSGIPRDTAVAIVSTGFRPDSAVRLNRVRRRTCRSALGASKRPVGTPTRRTPSRSSFNPGSDGRPPLTTPLPSLKGEAWCAPTDRRAPAFGGPPRCARRRQRGRTFRPRSF